MLHARPHAYTILHCLKLDTRIIYPSVQSVQRLYSFENNNNTFSEKDFLKKSYQNIYIYLHVRMALKMRNKSYQVLFRIKDIRPLVSYC